MAFELRRPSPPVDLGGGPGSVKKRVPKIFREALREKKTAPISSIGAGWGTVMWLKGNIFQYLRRTAMKLRPLHDRVVVKRIDAEEKSAGGIIIPDTAKEKPSQGEVVAVGPGGRDEAGKLIPIDLKVGDIVLFGKWSGTEVKIDGQDLLIMKESDIMGIIEGGHAAHEKAA
jgi:chaperonin GroES